MVEVKRKPGRPKKAITAPAVDKMVKEPERKKEIWDGMVERERNIHGGNGMTRP